MSKYTEEVSKTVAIAKEFIERAEKVTQHNGNEGVDNSALKRQSMELTRQLSVMRRPHRRY